MAATTRLTPHDLEIVEHYTKSGNSEPEWRTVRRLPASVSEDEVAAARRAVLRFGRFFPICEKCGKRTPTALMGKARVCQSCGGQPT
jgi:NADH pyrophosphatase NudC (nudix superfamily)